MPRASMLIAEAGSMPRWRRPEALLMLMAVASPLAFATWVELLNNFVVEKAAFDGFDIGVLHVAREIPGFLAFLVIYLLLILREQTLAFAALILLGLFTGLTSNFPSFWGLMLTTTLSSIGFHYYETIQQSLQLQWLPRERAPQGIGWIVSAGSFGSLVVFGLIIVAWEGLGLSYTAVYWSAGGGLRRPHPGRLGALSALRGAGGAVQDPDPAIALLALLRAGVHRRRPAADLHRLRPVHDGRALRAGGAPDHRADAVQLHRDHDLRPDGGAAGAPLWRAAGADRRVCRAVRRLRPLCRDLLLPLGGVAGDEPLRARPPAVRPRDRVEDLFPEDRRPGRPGADGGGIHHHQPHRRSDPAGAAGAVAAERPGGGLRAGSGAGDGVADARMLGAAASSGRARDSSGSAAVPAE